jgi:hypothetical protein
MHDVVLLVLPKWNVYVMMALSPNQNSCSRGPTAIPGMDYAVQRRMNHEHVCKWPA